MRIKIEHEDSTKRHLWFAWYPVKVNDTWTCFETLWRQKVDGVYVYSFIDAEDNNE